MAVDWSALTVAVNEIRPKVKATLDEVVELAAVANEKIGAQLAESVSAQVPGALEILAKVTTEIDAKTLTHDGAKAHFDKLKTLLAKNREELKPLVAQLPPATVEQIKAKMDKSLSDVVAIASRIYGLFQ